jgi:AraC-like DNA-binding protein
MALDPVQSYRERLPAHGLRHHVTSAWVLEVDAKGGAYEHRTVPNGAVEISYELGSDRIEVSGPQKGPVVTRVEPGTTIVGVRIRPGAAPAILVFPTSDLVDLRVGADQLWGSRVPTLDERLGSALVPGSALRLLEDEILHCLADAAPPDPLVTSAVMQLQPWRASSLGDWASATYISPRQLRRRFVNALGIGPKRFQRILRFQGFLALSQEHPHGHRSLARLAQRAGYSDQAHLTRESVALSGLSPRRLLEEMWRSCGPTHDHDASYAGLRRALLTSPRPLPPRARVAPRPVRC